MQYLYAQLNSADVCVGISQTHSELPLEAQSVSIDSYDTTLLGKRYDRATGMWAQVIDTEAQPKRRVSVLAFRLRFTPAEKAAIEWAAVDRPELPEAQRMQAASLRATLADQAAATFIDLDDPITVGGVQGLEAMGLIATGRAAEIIGAAILPVELP